MIPTPEISTSPFAGIPRKELLLMVEEFRAACPSGDPYELPGRSPQYPKQWIDNRLILELDRVTESESPQLRPITTTPDWSQFKLMAANYKTLKATSCVHYCGMDYVGEQVTLTTNHRDGSRLERNARLDMMAHMECARSMYRTLLKTNGQMMAAEAVQDLVGPTGIVARLRNENGVVWEYCIRVVPHSKDIGWEVHSRITGGEWSPYVPLSSVSLDAYGDLSVSLTKCLVEEADNGWKLEPLSAEVQNAVPGAIEAIPKPAPRKSKEKTTTKDGGFENTTTEAKRRLTLDAQFEETAEEWKREEGFAITPAGTKNLGLVPTWRGILSVGLEAIEEHPDKRWSVFMAVSGHRIIRNQATQRDAQVAAIRLSRMVDFTESPAEIRANHNKLMHPLCQQITKHGPYVPGPDFD